MPIGNCVEPVSESQVRPLLKLAELEQQLAAWSSAMEKAGGRQPTADVQEVVFEILHKEGPSEKSDTRSELRAKLMTDLKKIIAERKSWEKVEELISELERLL